MKGKPILVPVKEPKEGMKVVLNGRLDVIVTYPFKHDSGLADDIGYDVVVRYEGTQVIQNLQQIAIEYEEKDTSSRGFDFSDPHSTSKMVTIFLSPDMYEKALPLIGQEVEFIIWTGGRHVIGEPEFEPVAWIQESTPSPIVYTEEEVRDIALEAWDAMSRYDDFNKFWDKHKRNNHGNYKRRT
jgi:hypothetical protein